MDSTGVSESEEQVQPRGDTGAEVDTEVDTKVDTVLQDRRRRRSERRGWRTGVWIEGRNRRKKVVSSLTRGIKRTRRASLEPDTSRDIEGASPGLQNQERPRNRKARSERSAPSRASRGRCCGLRGNPADASSKSSESPRLLLRPRGSVCSQLPGLRR